MWLTQREQEFYGLCSLIFKQDLTRRLKNISENSLGLKQDTEMKWINNVLHPEERERQQQYRARWKTAGAGAYQEPEVPDIEREAAQHLDYSCQQDHILEVPEGRKAKH